MLLNFPAFAWLYFMLGETYCKGRSVGRFGGQLSSCGLFLCFSISDCKERILVAGLHTDLVRGTKTGKKREKLEKGVGVRGGEEG